MKIAIKTQFNIGDVVWRKNLVTNEAYQVTISRLAVFFNAEANKESYGVMYYVDGDSSMFNIPNRVQANNAFATKEDADACPPYDPAND